MAEKIKKLKTKLADGTYSTGVPFGADAANVDMANGKSVQETIGTINVDTDGTIAAQLQSKASGNNVYSKNDIDQKLEWGTVQL